MRIPRFYQPHSFSVGQTYAFSADTFHHAMQVLRLGVDDPLIIFNGDAGEFAARVVSISKKAAEFHLEAYDAVDRESVLSTTLVLAMIKPDKMDFAIQKAVELGVSVIQPVITERSVIRTKAPRMEKKLSHWEKIVISACEQSGRTKLPELKAPVEQSAFLQQQSDAKSLRLVMSPISADRLQSLASPTSAVELFIGPEGGYTDAELELFAHHHVTPITFGPRILRAETAVIAGLTALQQRWGDI